VAELEVSAELLARGAPVPRAALAVGRRVGLFWQACVGTVHEEDTRDAAAFLGTEPPTRRTLRAARAAGAALRRFHDAGGCHADLQAGNLLVREHDSDTEVLVIDLDRASIAQEVSPSRRMKELMRLYRSLLKRKLLDTVGRRGCAAFLSAYTGGDRGLRQALLAHLRRERLRVALHALRY
jgi:3-deoxy-D-manno-octulosonic acid kinase